MSSKQAEIELDILVDQETKEAAEQMCQKMGLTLNDAKIRKSGNSNEIHIPKVFLDALSLHENDRAELLQTMMISPSAKHRQCGMEHWRSD